MSNKELQKFEALLSKKFFSINQIRKFIENDFVTGVAQTAPDNEQPNLVRYSITLTNGNIHYVYVK